MNDKDFSELLACFREAGSKKPDRVIKIDPPATKSPRTKLPLAQDHADCAEEVSPKGASKKLTQLKDVKKPLCL